MNKRVEAVVEAARKLKRREQLQVVERIMRGEAPQKLSEADQAWLEIGEERFGAYARGEEEAYDAAEVLAEMRAWAAERRTGKRAKR